MVSFVNCIVAAAVAVATFTTPSAATLDVNELAEGTYFKPSGRYVSGVVGATTPFRRSPCPALNTLANHGYLPRNGQNVTKAVLGPAVMSVYNLGEDATATLLALVPDSFSLDYLATHNMIEHDASLIHNDEYFGGDPAAVNLTLAEQLLARGQTSGTLGVTELGAARKARLADSLAINPNITFGTTQQTLAFLEASILLLGFGSKTNESVAVDTARSFLVDEKIPDGWVRASSAISATDARTTAAKIAAASA
ncbi:chloroperoxidase [Phytophthora sojae]|uniref:Chloroperoxidase n=1 Tax=Phytophthora sojae (strain P6497) TaxID=1094619 RepID=G4ZCB7_PHYSP|nr:chloroperoxidase [Phytophthora sojae]EGZ22145.1 chloroperoxidase [Phytophthora sojae]|eukprot:XP_009524862.1 chloroperoxidase [Phytophthora sojae]